MSGLAKPDDAVISRKAFAIVVPSGIDVTFSLDHDWTMTIRAIRRPPVSPMVWVDLLMPGIWNVERSALVAAPREY